MALSENISNLFHTGDSCHRSVSFAAEPLKLFKMDGLVVLQKPDPINNLSQVPLSEIPKVGGGGRKCCAKPPKIQTGISRNSEAGNGTVYVASEAKI